MQRFIPRASIPRGSISVRAIPFGNTLKSEDLSAELPLIVPNGIDEYIKRATLENGNSQGPIYTPSVFVQRKGRHPEYAMEILAPPNLDENINLMLPGLVVPNLKISEVIERRDKLFGYVLTSDYTGSIEFFAPPVGIIRTLAENLEIMYQGRIVDTPYQTGKQRPKVMPLLDSSWRPEAFVQNKEKLEEIAQSNAQFWWTIDIDF